jgi:hypothetical protein
MFTWITVLSYAIASLHVPHSVLGVAMGLLGISRAAGGGVGNAILDTVFEVRFNAYAGPEIAAVALASGLSPDYLPEIIPGTIDYNSDISGAVEGIPGVTPAIKEALRVAIRNAYGHAFKIVFYVTIPFAVIALLCALFVEEPSAYMTNHIQSAMSRNDITRQKGLNEDMEKSDGAADINKGATATQLEDVGND